MFTYPTPFHPF